MPGTLIAPVIPLPPRPVPPARLPLPGPCRSWFRRRFPGDVVYGLARVDRSGHVADRTVTGAPGRRDGDLLTSPPRQAWWSSAATLTGTGPLLVPESVDRVLHGLARHVCIPLGVGGLSGSAWMALQRPGHAAGASVGCS